MNTVFLECPGASEIFHKGHCLPDLMHLFYCTRKLAKKKNLGSEFMRKKERDVNTSSMLCYMPHPVIWIQCRNKVTQSYFHNGSPVFVLKM